MIIGIGGISNSGKSKLAGRLKDYFKDKKVSVLCQDDYTFPKDKIPSVKDHVDWEHPDSIDYKWFHKTLVEHDKIFDIVIVEGIFAFHHEPTNVLMDIKIFLSLDKNIFMVRKSNDLRWGKEPDWYVEHIWNSHCEYCGHYTDIDALAINSDNPIDLKEVISFMSESLIWRDII